MFKMISIKNELNVSATDLSVVFDGMELFLFLPIKPKIGLYSLDASLPH